MQNPFAISTKDRWIPSKLDIQNWINVVNLNGGHHSFDHGLILKIKFFQDYESAAFVAVEAIIAGFTAPKWVNCGDGNIWYPDSIALIWMER